MQRINSVEGIPITQFQFSSLQTWQDTFKNFKRILSFILLPMYHGESFFYG